MVYMAVVLGKNRKYVAIRWCKFFKETIIVILSERMYSTVVA